MKKTNNPLKEFKETQFNTISQLDKAYTNIKENLTHYASMLSTKRLMYSGVTVILAGGIALGISHNALKKRTSILETTYKPQVELVKNIESTIKENENKLTEINILKHSTTIPKDKTTATYFSALDSLETEFKKTNTTLKNKKETINTKINNAIEPYVNTSKLVSDIYMITMIPVILFAFMNGYGKTYRKLDKKITEAYNTKIENLTKK